MINGLRTKSEPFDSTEPFEFSTKPCDNCDLDLRFAAIPQQHHNDIEVTKATTKVYNAMKRAKSIVTLQALDLTLQMSLRNMCTPGSEPDSLNARG